MTLSAALISAPCPTSSVTMSRCPLAAASMMPVRPRLSFMCSNTVALLSNRLTTCT